VRVGFQRELLVEGCNGVGTDLGIAEGPDAAATTEHHDMNTEPMQRLTQFEADNPGANDRHGLRQVVPIEHIVADDQAVAQFPERIGAVGARTGRNDDALGCDARMVSDRYRMVVHQTCMAANAVRVWNFLHITQDESNKAITLAPYALQDLTSIDADSALHMNAKTGSDSHSMGRISGGDQQLARHAAHPRAGGAIVAAFDQRGVRTLGFGGAIRSKACRAGTDYCNVDVQGFHVQSSCHRLARHRWQS